MSLIHLEVRGWPIPGRNRVGPWLAPSLHPCGLAIPRALFWETPKENLGYQQAPNRQPTSNPSGEAAAPAIDAVSFG